MQMVRQKTPMSAVYIYIYILYIKTQWGFFLKIFLILNFLFVCAELIEELGGARNVKFGTQVNNNESTIKFEELSKIFTPRRDR